MMSPIVQQQEEAKLDAMQRVWQMNRRSTSMSLFEDEAERELFALPRQDVKTDYQVTERRTKKKSVETPATQVLDASEVSDFPARYVITPVESHQFPVCGVYIDKRVIPGFKYRVRPLPAIGEPNSPEKLPCLFNGRAMTLQSIGRGYARRFTFESEKDCLNSNNNYFWSDNSPEGYSFELETISDGDKFTIFDANREAQGTLEVLNIEGPQVEISGSMNKQTIEKRVRVKMIGKVEFFETGVAKPMPITGLAIAVKQVKQRRAEVTKVINVIIKHHRYYLVPGVQKEHCRVTVRGSDANDVPTKYTMTGLEQYEIPIVGTYVDPRIIPGFHYRVCPNDRREHLFGGRALKLLSIGMGYSKRLTFQPDSLTNPNNYLWSDNHPDGLGLEPRAVHTGMKFAIITNDGQRLGEASVFRADLPQFEEKMERVLSDKVPGHSAIQKYIHIDVMCHVKFTITGGSSADNEEHLMRVHGLAIVRKEPKSNDSFIVRVENVGIDSQLNLLFAYNHTEIIFVPIVIK